MDVGTNPGVLDLRPRPDDIRRPLRTGPESSRLVGSRGRLLSFLQPHDGGVMDYRQLVSQSLEELRLKTAAHAQGWHLGEADWSVDQDVGEIVFETARGIVATCPVQIIGTFNTVDSTWLWGWDHPSVQPPLQEHAARVRDYGQAQGVSELTTRKLSCTEEQCWEFTALACKLNDAQGGYRGPSGPALVFMTFGVPQLSSGPDA